MSNDTSDSTDSQVRFTVVDESVGVLIGQSCISISKILSASLLLLLVIAPAILNSYIVGLLVLSFVFAIFALSVDLVWGYAGILTFGHAAFYGMGAYTMAILTTESSFTGVSLFALLLAFGLPALAGTVIAGVLFFRGISEEYFTIITLAIAIVANQSALIWSDVTGGSNGLTGIPSLGIDISGVVTYTVSESLFYFVALGMLVFIYFIGKRIINSPLGTTLIGISENESKASSLGYNPIMYKTIIFGISTGIAGLAGALYASYSGFVSPPILGFILSTEVLIWVLIGGRGTLIGPAIGATVLILAENMFSGMFLSTWVLLLGLILVAIVLVFPTGILGTSVIAEKKIIERIENK